jgi:hypothetical protein
VRCELLLADGLVSRRHAAYMLLWITIVTVGSSSTLATQEVGRM